MKVGFIIVIIIFMGMFTIPANAATSLSIGGVTVPWTTPDHINQFKQGLQLDASDWSRFIGSTTQQTYANLLSKMNLGYIRVFTFRMTGLGTGPCTLWNSVTHTGTFNWVSLDKVIAQIHNLGAEPILDFIQPVPTLPYPQLPKGMKVMSNGLPDPTDWGIYCAEWVKHYGSQVTYYEAFNEPFNYWGWYEDPVKLKNLMNLYVAAYSKMHAVRPSVMLSFDSVKMQHVTNYMVAHNIKCDYIDFHIYPGSTTAYDIKTILERSIYEYYGNPTTNTRYSIPEARAIFGNIPVLCSESNFNSVYAGDVDPRIHKIEGVMIDALLTMYGLRFDTIGRVHFFMSSKITDFGIIDSTTNVPRLEYYFYTMMAKNLSIGDPIYLSKATNFNLETLAWTHGDVKYIMVINKSTSTSVTLKTTSTGHIDYMSSAGLKTITMPTSFVLAPYNVAIYRTN
jgi:hypothetical protein